jgi:hypothetical protein
MANTYTLIASNTLGSSAASVTFSAIPNTYTDLVFKFSLRSIAASTGSSMLVKLNGSSSAIYSYRQLFGNGSTASSLSSNGDSSFSIRINGDSSTADTFNNGEIYLPSYTVAQNKPLSNFAVDEANTTAAGISAHAFLFGSTAAISSLDFTISGGSSFKTGSSFFLYGIKNS